MAQSATWRGEQYRKAADALDAAERNLTSGRAVTCAAVAEAWVSLARARYRAIEVDNQERWPRS